MIKDYKIYYEMNRIQVYDSRFYEIGGVKYPSVTTILNAKAKPYALMKWTKQMGLNADAIGAEAMDEGREVHDFSERYLRGEELVYNDNIKFHEVWQPVIRFTNFCEEYEVEPILIEQNIFSSKYCYAGTMDLLCIMTIDKKKYLVLLDIKRSKQSATAYEYQVASYYQAIKEMGILEQIKPYAEGLEFKAGLILLGVESKRGYRFTEVENLEDKFSYFMAVKKVWEGENKNFDMTLKEYPIKVRSDKYLEIYNKLNKEN